MQVPVIDLSKPLTIGLQGGQGSFNDLVADKWLSELPEYQRYQHNVQKKHLYTTKNVLEALKQKQITYGQFAVSNTLAGEVEETVAVWQDYEFTQVGQVEYPITLHLYGHLGVTQEQITTVMAHPHMLKECQQTVHQRWSHWQQLSGEGDAIDSATLAGLLAKGAVSKTTAIIGPPGLEKVYSLHVLVDHIHDTQSSTTFMICSLPSLFQSES